MNAQRIEGAVALVTGANRGIGRALTEALLTRGVRKVYATARKPEALRALRDDRLVPLRLDVTDVDQIRAAGELASDVELVFNNAGVMLASGIADSTVLDQARREMEVNYFGPLQLLNRLAPTLARNGGGGGRQHRLGSGPDQHALIPDLQRLEGRASLADPGRANSPRAAGHLGLRHLPGPR
jgi:NAD(P)-dependent dehydrogenase (short-subunit alcohol dehydrogenase family)